jgi:hypothetical protein
LLISTERIAAGLNYMPSNTKVVLVDREFDCSNSPSNFAGKFVLENSEVKFLPTAAATALNGMELTLKQ